MGQLEAVLSRFLDGWDPIPLHGMGDQNGRAPPRLARFGKAVQDGLKVMPTHLDHVPVEGTPFVTQRLDVVAPRHRPVGRHTVAIYNRSQLLQAHVAGDESGFPNAPFVTFPVAQYGVDAPRGIVELTGQR